MTIFGKPLSAYVSFAKGVLVLVAIVGIVRLALSLGGVDNATVKWLSISVATYVGIIYFAVRVHTTGFGSYKQLLVLIVITNFLAQAIVIAGIVIAIVTHHDNIFSAPEYSPTPADGKTWFHAGAHLIFGVIVGSLLAWAIGSLILFITKRVAKSDALPA